MMFWVPWTFRRSQVILQYMPNQTYRPGEGKIHLSVVQFLALESRSQGCRIAEENALGASGGQVTHPGLDEKTPASPNAR
jgi:hypothetical protein